MRSPGVMMAVVNTPDNIPAANSCGYLQETEPSRTITTRAPETRAAPPETEPSPTSGYHQGFSVVASCPTRIQRNRRRTWVWLQWWGRPCLYRAPLYPAREEDEEETSGGGSRDILDNANHSSMHPHLLGKGLFETIHGSLIYEALSRFGFGLSL